MSDDSASDKPKKKPEGEKPEKDPKPEKQSDNKTPHWWDGLIDVASTVSEKFGIAAVFLLLTLCTVWVFGTPETRDDFVRSFLFGSFKHKDESEVATHGVRVVLGLLAFAAMAEWVGGRWWKMNERDEMKRLNKENLKLRKKIASLQTPSAQAQDPVVPTPTPALPPAPSTATVSPRDKDAQLEQASPSQGKESSP